MLTYQPKEIDLDHLVIIFFLRFPSNFQPQTPRTSLNVVLWTTVQYLFLAPFNKLKVKTKPNRKMASVILTFTLVWGDAERPVWESLDLWFTWHCITCR